MEEEKKEFVMTKKQAQTLIEMLNASTRKGYAYFNDCVVKAFLYMKDNVDKKIDFYSKTKMKGVSKEAQDEIVRILNSIKDMITTQCDIVYNKDNAKIFNQEPFTVEDYMKGKHLGYGFSIYFDGNL